MNDDKQWRDRFLNLSEQADADKQRFEEAERELLRLITRLCVACLGLDEMLDPHLKRLRSAARDGSEGRLLQQAQAFGDALVQAQDDRAGGGLFEKLLDRSSLTGGNLKQALKLWRELAKAPAKAGNRQLDELGTLLFGENAANSGSGSAASGGGGLLGRLLNRNGGGARPNEVLRKLIEAMQWPVAMQHEVQELQLKLGANAADDAWVEVVKQIGQLAASAFDRVEQDAQAAGQFLAQLSERLQQIDAFVAGDGERRRAARESGMRLGQAVSDEVGNLSVQMQGDDDLDSLRSQVLGVLDRIQGHVAHHIAGESQRGLEAEQQAEALQQQLEQLEQETFDLRRQVAESHHKAMSDPLTGLANRRAFEERAAQELARWRRFGDPLALVVWDVDDFKQINDVFGHKAGDRALVLIARILHDSLRETDFIARYGGEEFVVLLTGAVEEDARKVAEVMRRNVESAGMHSHGKPVTITLSGGLALLEDDETIEQLFERADKAMYRAKKSGKNRVELADQSLSRAAQA